MALNGKGNGQGDGQEVRSETGLPQKESKTLNVEVAFALPNKQKIIALEVSAGCTVIEAVRLSNMVSFFPEIDLDNLVVGVFSKRLDGKAMPAINDYRLKEKDRVEIYRSLTLDPKEARLRRAEKAKKQRLQDSERKKRAK